MQSQNTLNILKRPRRLRTNSNVLKMVQETQLSLSDLIQPIFVEEGISEPVQIDTLPGVYRIPESHIEKEITEIYNLGIRYVMPFGISKHKDACGSDTWNEDGLVSRMTKAIKAACPDMIVIPDICFCEYTTHGHCGVVHDGYVDNDQTVVNLVKQSVAAAKAGADMLAPSSMMDGQIRAIRQGLDAAGYPNVGIMAHSIKFASAFYGPFRSAVECSLDGTRDAYQADYHNGRQVLIEATLDEEEGADILMVKPGTPYLDVLRSLRDNTNLPLAAYHVSGEYAILKNAAQAGLIDEKRAVIESMIGFKRAGASVIVTYYSKELAQWLAE
ncbi:porphobilinogen synthase [Vibrio sp.]|uniref:Delta-aminolevulinic acid dehydratase n=1 Tax=Vibrio viridaestus TaxID=2487322 RepID=A0A3N9TJV9_9VIBR|nr:porphobilinogen synthase [Vibrio viridaestus]MDC0611065.1 porphobilinogen synthase [Vibrio sp.]RQW64083.1 porphobilinogen synthase [Vibrio viridaestus]